MPIPQRGISQPVAIIDPLRPISGVVKGYQRRPVGNNRPLRLGGGAKGNNPFVQPLNPGLHSKGSAKTRIVGKIEIVQHSQLRQTERQRPGQIIALQMQDAQFLQVAQLCGNRPRQIVSAEIQTVEPAQVAQFRGNRPGQVISAESQAAEFAQLAQFRGNRPGQAAVVNLQGNQFGQVAQFRRQFSGQVVADYGVVSVGYQTQIGNPAPVIGSNSVPIPQGLAGKPAVVIGPLRPVSGMVKGYQRRPVGLPVGN